MIKAVGYIRVSTPGQATEDKTSPENQRKSIKEYISREGWKFVGFYEDLGISGGGMVERKGLQKLLFDASDGKFNKAVVDKLDRFGRNNEDLLHNRRVLDEMDVQLVSVSENIDDSYVGDLHVGIHGSIAQYEKDRIKERIMNGKVDKLKEGHAITGKLQYGRYFEYTKEMPFKRIYKGGEFDNGILLDRKAVEKMEYVYEQAVGEGRSFRQIAKDVDLKYTHLLKIIRYQLGEDFPIRFKGQKKIKKLREPVEVTIKQPCLLPADKQAELVAIIDKNRCYDKRPDLKDFPLSGFLKCNACGRAFSGQKQHKGTKYEKRYYRHPYRDIECRELSYINANDIEARVFKILFDNVYDKPAFEEAIKKELPDADYILDLENTISSRGNELKKIEKDLNKLIDAVLTGLLDKDVVKQRQNELLDRKDSLEKAIENAKDKLNSLPKLDEVKSRANYIRKELLYYFGSEERLSKMSYDDKRRMLYNLFGNDGGIFVSRNEKEIKIDVSAMLSVRGWKHFKRWKDVYKTDSRIIK